MAAGNESWIVIAEAPFVPAMGGGEKEHLGFVQTLSRMGMLAALVVPTDADPASVGRHDDMPAICDLCAPAPVIETPRRRSASAAVGVSPYVHLSRPFPESAVEEVVRVAPHATGIVAFSYKVAHMGRLLQERTGLPVVVRMHNVEGRYFRSIASSTSGLRKVPATLEAFRIDRDERRLEKCDWVGGLADISMADARMRGARATAPVIHVPTFALGPGREARVSRAAQAEEPTVLFLGALDVRTNVDAITWFAREVFPLVREAVPTVRWQVVGRAPTAEVRSLIEQVPCAELHADVPEPSVFLEAAWVAVNPAVSGSGVNIKLVEYLAAGTPVVSTGLGAQGLGLDPDKDLLVKDEPTAFARAVIELLRDPSGAATLGEQGRHSATAILDVEASVHLLEGMMHGR